MLQARTAAGKAQTVNRIELRPQPGPQTQYLSSPADIAIYGGAAGGGKTWSLLVEPLRHINNPRFGAVIFRRIAPEITRTGGMWDECTEIYPLLGGKPNQTTLTWKFPSRAKISFSHMMLESDKESWKGAQITLLCFDQLETFSKSQFFYMLSRNRSTCGIRPYIRATCNPDPESFLVDFLAWWIGDDGYAIPERSGVIRWFARTGETLIWGDSREEVVQKHPEPDKCQPFSVTFILARLKDNQILMQKDPGYLGRMLAQDPITRARLYGDPDRGGNWKVKAEGGKVFNRGWFKIVDAVPAHGIICRFWDFAATEKEIGKNDPDFTASVKMLRSGNDFYILDVTAEQLPGAEVERNFLNISRQEALTVPPGMIYKVRWEVEGGSAGKREAQRLTGLLAGIDAEGKSSSGDKLTRAKPLSAQAYAGNVYLLRGPWNEMYLEHMHNQPGWPHDDIMDGSSGAFNDLTDVSGTQTSSATVHRADGMFG